jgi:hypothetical protein
LKLDEVDHEFIAQTQAAGFRQRREGLAYRLSWPRLGVQPRKRVKPDSKSLSSRRKLIYRLRSLLTAWSHRMFWLARRTRRPQLYVRWAWTALATYHGWRIHVANSGRLVERTRFEDRNLRLIAKAPQSSS